MIGFSFCGKHSDDFGIFAASINRTLLPSKRLQQVTIPGRDGVYDTGKHNYNNRLITINIEFKGGRYTLQALRQKARNVAYWLDGKGKLVFDDELDKYYIAQVTDGIDIDQLGVWGQCQVNFDCEPFAYKERTVQQIGTGHNAVDYAGTAPTPTLIVLENNTDHPINNITITAIKRR